MINEENGSLLIFNGLAVLCNCGMLFVAEPELNELEALQLKLAWQRCDANTVQFLLTRTLTLQLACFLTHSILSVTVTKTQGGSTKKAVLLICMKTSSTSGNTGHESVPNQFRAVTLQVASALTIIR